MNRHVFSLNYLNKILFCATFILKFFTDVFYVAQEKSGIIVSVKYVTLLLGIFISFIIIRKKKEYKRRIIFRKETRYVAEVVIAFGVISLIAMTVRGNVTSQTLLELMYMGLAGAYAYGILNTLSFKDILQCMKVLLVFAIIAYIIEVGTGNFTIANLLLSNFKESYSPFESDYSASISMILCTFFAYYRKEKKWFWLSFVFCIATFKRLNIVFALFFLVYPLIFDPNKKVRKEVITCCKLFFIVSTVVLCSLYQLQQSSAFEKIFNVSMTQFSMGRNLMLQKLVSMGFKSYGYGSSLDFLGYSIEMDFVKIFLELGIIGLTIIIWRFYDISGTNMFCFLVMTENMLNCLTSHSLSSAFNWGLRFIVIGCILYSQRADFKGTPFLKKITYERVGAE